VNALASGERAVEDGDLVRKAPGELIRELRRQADFRDQNERGLAGCQEMLDGLHVDFSLTAAGDAVEENGAEAGRLGDGLEGTELIGCKFGGHWTLTRQCCAVPPSAGGGR